ncbi:hypothetical protein [Spirosoma lituiforme]
MTISLCHVTPETNIKAILRQGLRCDHQGYIYFFVDTTLTHRSGVSISTREAVAAHMRKTVENPYCVFQLDLEALKSPLKSCDDSSFGGQYHVRVKQAHIAPEYLTIVGKGMVDKLFTRHIRTLFMADEVGVNFTGQSLEEIYQVGLDKKIAEIIETCLNEPEKRAYYEQCAEDWGCTWPDAIAQLYRWRPETPWFHLHRAPLRWFYYPKLNEIV